MTDEINELAARGPNGELLFRIPWSTHVETCRRPSCKMIVWWVKTKRGKWMIVDCSIPNVTLEPDKALHADGIGAAHWGQCKDQEWVRGHK